MAKGITELISNFKELHPCAYKRIRENAIDECIKVVEESVWRDTDMLVENIMELKEGAEWVD